MSPLSKIKRHWTKIVEEVERITNYVCEKHQLYSETGINL